MKEVRSWLEAECCPTYRLDCRNPMGITEGPDQSPRRELLSRLEAGRCSSLRMDLKGLREVLPGPDFLKVIFFARPIFLSESFAQTKWAKNKQIFRKMTQKR